MTKAEQLKTKLNAQAVNFTGNAYNISFGSHAERYTEEQANRILDAEDAYMGESEYRQEVRGKKSEVREEKKEEEKAVTKIKGKVGIPVQTEPDLQGFRDSKTVEKEQEKTLDAFAGGEMLDPNMPKQKTEDTSENDRFKEEKQKKIQQETDTISDPNMPGLTKGYKQVTGNKKSKRKKSTEGKTGTKRTGKGFFRF